MKKLVLIVSILGIVAILTSSCNKSEKTINQDTSASADDALAESLFENVTKVVDEAYDSGSGNSKSSDETQYVNGCAVVTIDLTVYPYSLIVDFGDENCLCEDNRYRRGKILVTFNGEYREPGTVITYGFDNYHVNDYQIDGTKIITNLGQNNDGNINYNISVVGVINFPDNGGTISWNATKNREWIEGIDTWTHLDDVYLITGSSEGIRSNGLQWTRNILIPLRVEIGCKWIVSGTMEVAPEGIPARLFDWGNGDCDNIATVVVNGVTYTIFLP